MSMKHETEWRTHIHDDDDVEGVQTGAYTHPQITSLQ